MWGNLMFKKTLKLAFLAIIIPVFFTGIANAQVIEREGIEEIIVTAQKTEQNIQDVPIAVTAFDTGSLELQQIETFGDIQFNAPNITFTKGNFTGSNFVIRGVNSYTVAASGDSGVAFHINNVPVATRIFETEYYDLERVEILRGPQGTLYGASSTGGTVNMLFANPSDEFESSVELEVGDYDHRKIKAMVNAPISDSLSLRIAGLMLERNGFSENLFPGREGEDLDGRDITSWRFTLRGEISDNTSAKLTYWNFEEDDNRSRIGRQMCKSTEVPSYGCHPSEFGRGGPAGSSTFGGDVSAIAGLMTWSPLDYMNKIPRNQAARSTYQNMDPVYKASEDGYLLNIETEALESFTIRANVLYHETSVFSQQDYNNNDGTAKFATYNPNNLNPLVASGNPAFPQGVVPVSQYTESACGIFCGAVQGYYDYAFAYDTSSGEAESKYADLVIQSTFDGPINFVAGINVSEYESNGVYDVYFSGADAAAIAPILAGLKLYPSHYRNETAPYELERKSVFTELYYQANPDLKVTIGARWNESEKSVQDRQLLFNSAILAGGTGVGDPVTLAVQTADPNLIPVIIGAASSGIYEPIPGKGEQRRLQGISTSFVEKEVSGKIGIDWTPDLEGTDSTLVYATWSRGYRPGAFNPPVDPTLFQGVAQTTDPEFLDAYEIGMKNVLLDNTLIANLTAFYYDYQGLQVSKIIARTSVNENIDAEMQGLEVELFWSPSSIPGLRLDAQVSLLETEVANGTFSLNPLDKVQRNLGDTSGWLVKDYTNGATCGFKRNSVLAGVAGGVLNLNPAAGALDMIAAPKTLSIDNINSSDPSGTVNPLAQIAGGALPTLGNCATMNAKLSAAGLGGFYEPEYDISGNELVQAPAVTVHVGAEYTTQLTNISITSRIDYYWQDDFYSRLYNVPRDIVEEWDVLNAQIIFQSLNNPWYVRVWGQNLMDDDNITGHYFTAEASGGFRNDFMIDPRMVGITFGAKF